MPFTYESRDPLKLGLTLPQRRELDQAELHEQLRELKEAVDDPLGFAAFLAATPTEHNYQLAAILIQLEQAQALAARGP